MLRGFASILAMLGALHFAVPAQACIMTTPAARAWVQCSYKVAWQRGDHGFVRNFTRAKATKKKLLPGAQPRWDKLERRFNAACGTFAAARERDEANFSKLKNNGRYGIPENAFDAYLNTSDFDELVKTNA
ncbi:MAG TPA: hypothetical protein VEZ59_06685 [Sphingopyxis sp.]|nr:hypothetical protein [Sphingopyxis sp.]